MFPGSKQLLLNRALGGGHVLTVRDGDVQAAAVGLCHRAGMGGKRVQWVMLRWRRPLL